MDIHRQAILTSFYIVAITVLSVLAHNVISIFKNNKRRRSRGGRNKQKDKGLLGHRPVSQHCSPRPPPNILDCVKCVNNSNTNNDRRQRETTVTNTSQDIVQSPQDQNTSSNTKQHYVTKKQ